MKAMFKERAMKRDSMVEEETLEYCKSCREGMKITSSCLLFFFFPETQKFSNGRKRHAFGLRSSSLFRYIIYFSEKNAILFYSFLYVDCLEDLAKSELRLEEDMYVK